MNSGINTGKNTGKAREQEPALLPVSYSTVSSDALQQLVQSRYDLPAPVTVKFWERGVNDTYKVLTADQSYSLRLFRHQLRTRDEIEFEVEAMNHLHEQGFPLAYPIATTEGEYILDIKAAEGLRYLLLTAHAEGETLRYEKPEDARLFGETAARLHQLSDDFVPSKPKYATSLTQLLDRSLAIVAPYVAHRKEDAQYLRQLADDARAAVEAIPDSELDLGFCHGDFHGYNAHFSKDAKTGEGTLTHYDFDCCGMGYRIFDIATFCWSVRLDDAPEARFTAFLEGYQSVRKISETDISLLHPFIMIRHIWLMALHMGNADDFGHGVTSDSYITHQKRNFERLIKREESKHEDAEQGKDTAADEAAKTS